MDKCVTLGFIPRVQGNPLGHRSIPWMLGTSPSMTSREEFLKEITS